MRNFIRLPYLNKYFSTIVPISAAEQPYFRAPTSTLNFTIPETASELSLTVLNFSEIPQSG